ncbi:electron transporter [Jeongeupia sp. HS-3]|uniref:SCO family protein n=1 Tax=Jeongeupia sp. HS-3 TaxID=1009682 RepID=UPI0018A3EF43|nr:SCO family protein [Jeongeupia sp. HS-3]BCL74570.1 electron transporter [Jeongeupia sp. HS-3]
MLTRRMLTAGASLGALAFMAGGWLGRSQGKNVATPFPNTPLQTHDGRAVRFYDDLIRGKLVVINMIYASCGGICPATTFNLRQVHRQLGERVGSSVFLYSITLQPELDTPDTLRAYAQSNRLGPGWLLLTGSPDELRKLRYRLGFFDPDPQIDRIVSSHTGMLRIGNDATSRWTMIPGLAAPEQILHTIDHVDPTITHPNRIYRI